MNKTVCQEDRQKCLIGQAAVIRSLAVQQRWSLDCLKGRKIKLIRIPWIFYEKENFALPLLSL